MKLTSARDPHMQLNPKWGMGDRFAHSINEILFCRLTYNGVKILDLGLTIFCFLGQIGLTRTNYWNLNIFWLMDTNILSYKEMNRQYISS